MMIRYVWAMSVRNYGGPPSPYTRLPHAPPARSVPSSRSEALDQDRPPGPVPGPAGPWLGHRPPGGGSPPGAVRVAPAGPAWASGRLLRARGIGGVLPRGPGPGSEPPGGLRGEDERAALRRGPGGWL